MRFKKGVRFPHFRRPRGPGRGDPVYEMSREAYQARLRNASKARAALAARPEQRDRTYGETRRLELEIALASVRGETYRAMAKRLGCSHVYCWDVARRYRNGQIPMLPHDGQELIEFRDSLDGEFRQLDQAHYKISLSVVPQATREALYEQIKSGRVSAR